MRVTATQSPTEPPPFRPVSLSITLETVDEVQAFYDLFNIVVISDVQYALKRAVPAINLRAVDGIAGSMWSALNKRFGPIGHGERRIA